MTSDKSDAEEETENSCESLREQIRRFIRQSRVILCLLITIAAIVNFLSRPFESLEVISTAPLSPVDRVLYTCPAW